MIRVITRDLTGDTGIGSLIGDFPPSEIGDLLRLMQTVPGFSLDDCSYARVAEDVQGGPLQWVVRDGRVVVEILTEAYEDDPPYL